MAKASVFIKLVRIVVFITGVISFPHETDCEFTNIQKSSQPKGQLLVESLALWPGSLFC